MKRIAFRTLIVVLLPISAVAWRGAYFAPTDEVGDVVFSVLPPQLFNQVHTGTWVLMDGNPLDSGSPLSQFLQRAGVTQTLLPIQNGTTRVPDARGVFLRGMNIGRDSLSGDSEGDRRVGTYQADELKSHRHNFGGLNMTRNDVRGGNDKDLAHRMPDSTAAVGGKETRPRNIALYVYIKIGAE